MILAEEQSTTIPNPGKKGQIPLFSFLLQPFNMILNLITCSLDFCIFQTELTPLCGQSIQLVCSVLLINHQRMHKRPTY